MAARSAYGHLWLRMIRKRARVNDSPHSSVHAFANRHNEKGGGHRPPPLKFVTRIGLRRLLELEVQPQRHLNDAWVAAEDLVRLVERRPSDRVDIRDARRSDWDNSIWRAGDVLPMVESIEEIRAELKLPAFSQLEVLEDREVEVLDARQRQGVAARSRNDATPGLDVLGIRIIRKVAHGSLRVGLKATTVDIK